MKTREKLVLKVLAVGLLAVTAVAGTSFSQSMSNRENGSFTLPFEAHWGTLDLKPGAYSFSVKHEVADTDLVTVKQGDRALGFVVADLFTPSPEATQPSGDALLCAKHNGGCAIAALELSRKGLYHFCVPRDKETSRAATASNLTESIPVLFAQK